jgi:sugar-specific transcriptional regulator TrmB
MSNQSKIIGILEDLGLSDTESRVYFAMLSMGPATILAISKASEVKRTTIYNVLEGLNRKGLTRIEIKGFKKLYVAEHPKKLENILDARKNELTNLFPELEALYNLKGGESFIKYYEGSESIKNAYYDMLDTLQHNDEFLVVGDPQRWEDTNKSFAKDFIAKRNKQTLRIRMILADSELARTYKKFERNFNEEIKLLPPDSKIETNFVITPQKIFIQQMFSPVLVVTIENKSIINMHREFFNVMWNTLEG